MNERVTYLLLLCGALLQPILAATAEPRTVKTIMVEIQGCTVTKASIVLGKDHLALALQPAGNGKWTFTKTESFDADAALASLRLHPGRTTCRHAQPYSSEENAKVAEFVFQCTPGEYRTIELDIGKRAPVAYRRDVSADEESLPCFEDGVFKLGKGNVTDIEAGGETIFVFPGFEKPHPRWTGILVSGLEEAAESEPAVKKLDGDDLGQLFLEQIGAGKAAAPPGLPDNWRLYVELMLKRRGAAVRP